METFFILGMIVLPLGLCVITALQQLWLPTQQVMMCRLHALVYGFLLAVLGLAWTHFNFLHASQRLSVLQSTPHWLVEWRVNWIPSMGVSFHFGLDGLTWLFLCCIFLLALFALAILSLRLSRQDANQQQGSELLWVATATTLSSLIILSKDLFLWAFAWQLVVLLICVLLGVKAFQYQSKAKHQPAESTEHALRSQALNQLDLPPSGLTRLLVIGQAMWLIKLAALVLLMIVTYSQTRQMSFDYDKLLGMQLPVLWQTIVALGVLGLSVLFLPLLPFHKLVLTIHTERMGYLKMIFLMVSLLSLYTVVRMLLPLFPDAVAHGSSWVQGASLVVMFYAALVAYSQQTHAAAFTYVGLFHIAFVLFCVFLGSYNALQAVMMYVGIVVVSLAGLQLVASMMRLKQSTNESTSAASGVLSAAFCFFAVTLAVAPLSGMFLGWYKVMFDVYQLSPLKACFVCVAHVILVLAVLRAVQQARQAYVASSGSKKADKTCVKDLSEQQTVSATPLNSVAKQPVYIAQKVLLLSAMLVVVTSMLYPSIVWDTTHESMRWTEYAYKQPSHIRKDTTGELGFSPLVKPHNLPAAKSNAQLDAKPDTKQNTNLNTKQNTGEVTP